MRRLLRPPELPDRSSPVRPLKHRRSRRGRRAALVVLAVVVLVLAAVGADLGLLASRVDHVAVRLPHGGSGETWVIIGSDSRADIPSGASQSQFGSTAAVPGARADVVLVVHREHGRTTTLDVPRDLLVGAGGDDLERLTLEMQRAGPQGVVDALCSSLGVAATHVVVVDMGGFASIVDELGGIEVDVPQAVMDPTAGLRIEHAGRQKLDGATALALVRSRDPVPLDGSPVSGAAGAVARSVSTTEVFAAVRAAAHADRDDPIALQRLAWTATGVLKTDHGTGLFDLASLARAGVPAGTVLPAAASGSDLVVTIDDATRQAVAAAGITGGCTVAH